MRIVTDGTKYAIQKGWIFKRYRDLMPGCTFWWSKNSFFFIDCWSSDIDYVKKKFNNLTIAKRIVPYIIKND